MTVASTAAKAGPYTGNDVTSSFAFSFKVFADADIRVVETLISTGIETDLVLNDANGYTVTRNADQDNNPGGTITYKQAGITAALPSTKKLTIVGDFTFEQPTDLPNGGPYFASVVENSLDRLELQIKQLKEVVDRAVVVDVSSTDDPDDLIDDLIAASVAAAASEAAAAASAATAAGLLDDFDDLYLGAKAVAPTLDNDGDALVDGALYWNTVVGRLFGYRTATASWVDPTADAADLTYTTTAAAGGSPTTGQVKFDEVPSTSDFALFSSLTALTGGVLVKEGPHTLSGTYDFDSAALNGKATNVSVINLATALTTDYGIHFADYCAVRDLTINHTCNATGTVNGRSNCSILFGAKLSSDDTASQGSSISNVKVNYTDTATFAGNTVAGFGDVADVDIRRLDITTNAETALQFHWGYNAGSTRTNHPRHINIEQLKVTGSAGNSTVGFYLSGCHNIALRNSIIKDCDQGIIIGAGDVGGGRDPQNESVDLIMGAISIEKVTLENIKNDAFLINGASFILGASVEPLFPNQRWIAADYQNVGISIRDVTVIRETDSSNNPISLLHLRNTVLDNVSVGLKSGFQDTDTTEALSLTACNDSIIEMKSNCVVAVNCLSGKNNQITVNHVNSDVDNTTSQNGIVLRGSIVNAIVRDAVAINDDSIVITTLTCDIHKGMKFENGGTVFEFDGHARLSSTGSENSGVRVPIVAATATIAAGQTIEQYYCIHDVKISGRIRGMNKGIRIISTDARVPFNVEIDADFEKNVASDIEVPVGITIKYKGVYYYNDSGATMTFLNGVAVQTAVISYTIVNGRRIGSALAAPTAGTWAKGDVLFNRNTAAAGSPGWACTTAGTPGTWKTMAVVAA